MTAKLSARQIEILNKMACGWELAHRHWSETISLQEGGQGSGGLSTTICLDELQNLMSNGMIEKTSESYGDEIYGLTRNGLDVAVS